MTRDEAIEQLLRQCGQRQNDAQARLDAIKQMVNAQNRLERSALQPWWLVDIYTDPGIFVTSVGIDTVALPSGFLREIDDSVTDIGSLWYYDSDEAKWRAIYKEDYAIAVRQYGNGDTGAPRLYCLMGTDIMLFPAPTEVWDLRWVACFQQESLDGAYGGQGNIENSWLTYASDLMIGETGRILCSGYWRDDTGAAHFTAMAKDARDRVVIETQAKYEAGLLRAMMV